jgi:Tripartite tricarboxylate transporter TctB family
LRLHCVKEEYGLSRKKIDFLFSALVVVFLIWALWEARNWPGHSRLFPWSLGFIVLSLALTQLGLAWRGIVREGRTDPIGGRNGLDDIGKSPSGAANDPVAQKILVTPDTARQRIVTICCWIVGFFIGVWLLGFKLGSLCLTLVFLKFTAHEKWMLSTVMAVATYLFFWLVFDIMLRAPLGGGFIGDYFGLN